MICQFEVWTYDFPNKGGPHPCVVISRTDACTRPFVNVLFCTSQRQSRQLKPMEVLLNGADGLNWETFCDCSILWAVETAKLSNKRGHVSHERRNLIRDKVRDIFRLPARD
jgi:mRNA-degrading endonuclease toxin of MazEF toxin-antitoxin module